MKLYAFQLGRKKELCLAELLTVLGHKNLVEETSDAALFQISDSDLTENPHALQDKLGGTIKTIEIVDTISNSSNLIPDIEKSIEKLLSENFSDHSGKLPFALSKLSFKDPQQINIKKLLNFSKIFLKSLNVSCRFVNQGDKNPKPSTIFKGRLIRKGIDINIIKGSQNTYIGRSISIQNINAYSKRDFDKPKRDAKVGMTPPKLAQIMINLAGPCKSIFDPFCGTGTFLIEAMLMGKEAIGSDIDERMVQYSQENCKWAEQAFKTSSNFHIFKKDARFIIPENLPAEIDAVITEGYLGEPLTKFPSPEHQETTFRELENLHLNWLKAINPLLPEAGKVVMCLAAFKQGKTIVRATKFEQLAETAGYKLEHSYLYDRPDQIVAREIKVLSKI